MPRPDEISPERLDALIDGEAPATGDEEALAGLMTELRASEGPSADLRARVSGITRPRQSAWSRAVRWMRNAGWAGRAMALAPVCVLIVGAVFAVSSINRDDAVVQSAAEERAAAPAPSAASGVAQGPLSQAEITVRLPEVSDLADVGRRVRQLASATRGRTVEETYRTTTEGAGGAGLVVVLDVPADRYDEARAALSELGSIASEETTYGSADAAAAAPPTAQEDRLADATKPADASAGARLTVTFITP
jgi:hypothetical protein